MRRLWKRREQEQRPEQVSVLDLGASAVKALVIQRSVFDRLLLLSFPISVTSVQISREYHTPLIGVLLLLPLP